MIVSELIREARGQLGFTPALFAFHAARHKVTSQERAIIERDLGERISQEHPGAEKATGSISRGDITLFYVAARSQQ